jgi:hypothetical protein
MPGSGWLLRHRVNPLGEAQAERRDEREDLRHHVHGDGNGGGRVAESGQRPDREHEQHQGQAEEGGPGQFHHGRHGEQRQRGELDQEERREEKRPVKDRVRRNRRIGPGHDDEVEGQLEDHRCGHRGDDRTRQPYPEGTRGGDEDDDEQDDRRSQGHHRDGVGWRSFGDVLVHLLPHVGRPAG